MTLLASLSDAFGFGMLLLASVSVPSVGLIVSGVTLTKRGLNPWCGWATLVFFLSLLVGSIVWALANRGGADPAVMLYTLLGCCGVHVLSALMALVGLAQIRQRRKWTHGRRRGMWVFWLNVLVILIISGWCYVHVNPWLSKRLMG
jgi:hypothetical protein